MSLRSLNNGPSVYPFPRLVPSQHLRKKLLGMLWVVCGLCAPSLSGEENWSPSNFSRVDWQPTRVVKDGNYVDSQTCAKCHPAEAATQLTSPMGLALEKAIDCEILRSRPHL